MKSLNASIHLLYPELIKNFGFSYTLNTQMACVVVISVTYMQQRV